MKQVGYGSLVEGIDPWAISRFAGLGCPWVVGMPLEGETVVDLGCGAGADVAIASKAVGQRGRVVGVDLRPHLLGRCALPVNAAVLRTNAAMLPLKSGTIGLVTANGLSPLLRLTSASDILGEVRRVLRPDGQLRLIALVTGEDVPLDEVSDLLVLNAERVGKPVCAQWRSVLVAHGFEVSSIVLLPSPFSESFRSGPVRAALLEASRA
jgi:ubiquinone/menaquinone biosynthesis C-methylase UbiE